jgi:hypothetical protein
MASLLETLERTRSTVTRNGNDALRRTREEGARLLVKAEVALQGFEGAIALRREALNGRRIEQLERRLLGGLEGLLDRLGWGLRVQIQRLELRPEASHAPSPKRATLAPRASEPTSHVATSTLATKALKSNVASSSLANKGTLASKSAAKPKAKVARTARLDQKAPRVSAKSSSPKSSSPKLSSPKPSSASKTSTRWVTPQLSTDELLELAAKQLVEKLPELPLEECRVLLGREKSGRKRRAVLTALEARLSVS